MATGQESIMFQPDFWDMALLAVIGLCCLGGMIGHVMAKKHILPGQNWNLRKDSLLQRRHLSYDEKGMRYVALQQLLIMVMMLAFAGFLVKNHF